MKRDLAAVSVREVQCLVFKAVVDMADARALGVFQERVKCLLGSLLLEITEAYRESLCRSRCKSLMLTTDTTALLN